MSSLDMDALFGRVAKETLPDQLHVADYSQTRVESLPELLHPSRASAALSAPTPHPRHDKATLDAHASPVDRQSQKVLPSSGRGYVKSDGIVATNPTAAQFQGPFSAAPRQSSLCHLTALSDVELLPSHSGAEEEAEAWRASREQYRPSAKQPNADVRASLAESSTGTEPPSRAVDAACAIPSAQGLHLPLVQDMLTQAGASDQTAQPGGLSQSAMPDSQSTSLHLQEAKHAAPQAHSLPSPASTLATSWPDVTHVSKLRHGEQLRQAAAEAAATAAGQAARAESSIRVRTPPTIAFHSMAAKHAMVAAEAAAAAAAVTADCRIPRTATDPQHSAGQLGAHSSLLEGHAEVRARRLLAPAPRGGRLHASAPASPVHRGKGSISALHTAGHGLSDMDSQYVGCSLDLADVRGCVKYQHGSRGEHCGMQQLSGHEVLPSAASAPTSPVRHRMAGTSTRRHQQLPREQQSPRASCNDRLAVAAQPHQLLQQQSIHSTDAGWRQGTTGSQQRHSSDQAQQSRQHVQIPQHGQGSAPVQQAQRAKRSQQAQHAQQATRHQEQAQPMQDPFQASDRFPVCPELSLLPSRSSQQDRQQGLLTDSTNFSTAPRSLCCQTVKPAARGHAQQMRHGSTAADAAVTAVDGHCMAVQRKSCLELIRPRCDDAVTVPAQPRGRADRADRADTAEELLSSLTEEEFWEAARAELLDTADAVRHRSCMSQLQGGSPCKMPELPVHDGGSQNTPDPRKPIGQLLPSGITPLLDCKGRASHMKLCLPTLQMEDSDDPLKADWGL
ncbi:hypothetical protein ABBQ38_002282 [Trebouxia sp. C0009 RCD-2024]